MALYAQALRELGRWLGDRQRARRGRAAAVGAERLAESLSPAWRCGPTAASTSARRSSPTTSHLAGVAEFTDLDSLTIFADNLVPHVLRMAGVLVYDDALAAHIDARAPA